jgi:hypothetical protein
MNKLFFGILMSLSSIILGSQSENFTNVQTPDEFNKLMGGPTVFYLYSRASNKHHFSDQMHNQVVAKFKELASEHSNINFADMEWSRPAQGNSANPILYNSCLQNNKIDLDAMPHFLFFYNMQELFRLVILSASSKDISDNMFIKYKTGHKLPVQISGKLFQELGIFINKLKEESKTQNHS